MPRPLDKDEPSGGNSLNTVKESKFKLFFSRLFLKDKALPKNEYDEVHSVIVEPKPDTEEDIISNIDGFINKTVEDVMIPRADIISISIDATLEELSKSIVKYSHTRILIYKERLDNIVGFVHIKDIFEIIAKSKNFNLKKVLRKHIISPHSMKLVDLLAQMQMNRTHIAVVVDEYGGTDGLVTIEDIIEEIVGRIDDEHDIGLDEDYKILKPGLIVTNARVEIEELENVLGTKLKTTDDEIDTIGGLVMAKSGSVPEKGEVVDITDNVVAEILESTPRTIKQIKLTYSTR